MDQPHRHAALGAEPIRTIERMRAGCYEGHAIDIDGLNARFLAAMADQPWEVAWVQANARQSMMLETWRGSSDPTEEAAWWIRKAGAEHVAEHLERLRVWVAELVARRVVEREEEPGSAVAEEPDR